MITPSDMEVSITLCCLPESPFACLACATIRPIDGVSNPQGQVAAWALGVRCGKFGVHQKVSVVCVNATYLSMHDVRGGAKGGMMFAKLEWRRKFAKEVVTSEPTQLSWYPMRTQLSGLHRSNVQGY